MKKIFILAAFCFISITMNAQILRAEELEKYAKEKYGEKWIDAAANLKLRINLDKNRCLTFVQVINADGKSKEQLYVLLNYWITHTFTDANSVIQLNDKELGRIIAKGYVKSIAYHIGGSNSYDVSITPVIKCDIKDEKVRVTYTAPFYSVIKNEAGGWMTRNTTPSIHKENWTLDSCYPFATKDSHKKTSAKAFVMTYAYSNVIMDKIEEVITNGMIGNELEDW